MSSVATTKHFLKELPLNQAIMLVARHGVGKSSVVKEVATTHFGGFVDNRLSQKEVGDILGLPYLDVESGQTKYLKPWWWPRDKDSSGILFFDELNRASKDVLQAVFEICLDRRLDGEELPAGWRVVAAINADDDYDVAELDPALKDRWFHINFKPTAQEWLAWASSNPPGSDEPRLVKQITDFISSNNMYLDPPTAGNLDVSLVHPSRRSWQFLSDAMRKLGLDSESPNIPLLNELAAGWVGAGPQASFVKFVQSEFRVGEVDFDKLLLKFDQKQFTRFKKLSTDAENAVRFINQIIQWLVEHPQHISKGSAEFSAVGDNFIKIGQAMNKEKFAVLFKNLMDLSSSKKEYEQRGYDDKAFDAAKKSLKDFGIRLKQSKPEFSKLVIDSLDVSNS